MTRWITLIVFAGAAAGFFAWRSQEISSSQGETPAGRERALEATMTGAPRADDASAGVSPPMAAAEQVPPPEPVKPGESVPGRHFAPADDFRVTRNSDGTVYYNPSIELARQLHAADGGPQEDIEILDQVIGFYHLIFRENPVAGFNEEVVAAITGENPMNVVFIEPDHPALDGKHQLQDRWGTPYRFHAVSGHEMEIFSAGPDGKFGTSDDFGVDRDSDRLGLRVEK